MMRVMPWRGDWQAMHAMNFFYMVLLLPGHTVLPCALPSWAHQVRGEGVIGKYPLLEPDGPEFVYQSCTFQVGGRA